MAAKNQTPAQPDQSPRRWLSQQQAADYLGVTDRTIRNLISRGVVRGYRLGTRSVRIDARELDAALRPIPTSGLQDPAA